jgi:hypothetical protein
MECPVNNSMPFKLVEDFNLAYNLIGEREALCSCCSLISLAGPQQTIVLGGEGEGGGGR